ncbi:MAG: hypothetical protein Q9191_002374 [Dirinaria sp. TL-2023a]
MDTRPFGELEDRKDIGLDQVDSQDHWRFTPLLDSNSLVLPSFTNQPSGYYTPTLGAANTIYHNRAGDLHTPGVGFQLGTPLSMPTVDGQVHATSAIEMHGFHPSVLSSNAFQPPNAFAQQQSYAPSSFVHQDSGFGGMELSHHMTPKQEMGLNSGSQPDTNVAPSTLRPFNTAMPTLGLQSMEQFRYRVTLNAPTAMVKSAEEIPITYLNKGQAYSVSISDSQPLDPKPAPVKYRTVIRISFEDEQQRQRPSACWQLWKEGRGLAEAHMRGGRLQAVEYVDANQGGAGEEGRRPRVELENSSFDCFSIIWTPPSSAATADCSVAVRFNFLSTDFSHSKGVKGIPVRLCAKTEVISSGTPDTPPGPTAEVCFCKVKLFRDHGAERKLSNDVAHIKKTIEKLKQQIAQAESGSMQSGKRKRSGSMATKGGSNRPAKVQKHKRSSSVSSQNSGGRPAFDDDLHTKLASTEAMFTSTRPVSLLHLKGYPEDDPDQYPVTLPGQRADVPQSGTVSRKASWDTRQSTGTSQATPTTSCLESPTPAPQSMQSQSQPPMEEHAVLQNSAFYSASRHASVDWDNFTPLGNTQLKHSAIDAGPVLGSEAVKIQKGPCDGAFPDWFEALGVDPSYKAPPERPIKPVACFYVLIKVKGRAPEDDYYRAVYLMARTVEDLIRSITTKCQVEPSRVRRATRVNSKGLKIMVDDEVVQELPEGQDMAVEFSAIDSAVSFKQEPGQAVPQLPLEMRLMY